MYLPFKTFLFINVKARKIGNIFERYDPKISSSKKRPPNLSGLAFSHPKIFFPENVFLPKY